MLSPPSFEKESLLTMPVDDMDETWPIGTDTVVGLTYADRTVYLWMGLDSSRYKVLIMTKDEAAEIGDILQKYASMV